MSDNTSIEWASATWNPIRGTAGRHTCARISPGCDNCYAATMNRRGLGDTQALDFGSGETLIDPARLDEKALLQPLHWKRPRRIFVCSMTDLFGSWVPEAWLLRIFGVMTLTPQHTYIVLTKRATRMQEFVSGLGTRDLKRGAVDALFPGKLDTGINNICAALLTVEHQTILHSLATSILPHVWFGVTIESDRFTWRANYLRQTPATVRWVSAEPLLSGLPSLDLTRIDWLVAGGESGHKARPMHPDWARDLRDRCAAARTAFFFKQWGNWADATDVPPNVWPKADGSRQQQIITSAGEVIGAGVGNHGSVDLDWRERGGAWMVNMGNHLTGRLLDGREWNEYPSVAAAGVAS